MSGPSLLRVMSIDKPLLRSRSLTQLSGYVGQDTSRLLRNCTSCREMPASADETQNPVPKTGEINSENVLLRTIPSQIPSLTTPALVCGSKKRQRTSPLVSEPKRQAAHSLSLSFASSPDESIPGSDAGVDDMIYETTLSSTGDTSEGEIVVKDNRQPSPRTNLSVGRKKACREQRTTLGREESGSRVNRQTSPAAEKSVGAKGSSGDMQVEGLQPLRTSTPDPNKCPGEFRQQEHARRQEKRRAALALRSGQGSNGLRRVPGNLRPQRKETTGPSAATILVRTKSQKESLYRVPFGVIQKAFQQVGEVTAIRHIRGGGLALDFAHGTDLSMALCVKLLSDNEVTCTAPVQSPCRSGIIGGVPLRYSDEDLAGLIQGDPSNSVAVRRVERLGSRADPSRTVKLVFEGNNLPAKVAILGNWHPVQVAVDRPRQCTNCQRFFHVARDCRGKARCRNCGGLHATKLCEDSAQPRCVNCHGAHKAADIRCPHVVKAREICKVKATDNIPMAEARAKVSATYAEAAKSGPTSGRPAEKNAPRDTTKAAPAEVPEVAKAGPATSRPASKPKPKQGKVTKPKVAPTKGPKVTRASRSIGTQTDLHPTLPIPDPNSTPTISPSLSLPPSSPPLPIPITPISSPVQSCSSTDKVRDLVDSHDFNNLVSLLLGNGSVDREEIISTLTNCFSAFLTGLLSRNSPLQTQYGP